MIDPLAVKTALTISIRRKQRIQELEKGDPKEIFYFLMQSLAPFTTDELQIFTRTLTIERYKPGQSFIREGELSNKVGFVLKGLFKSYTLSTKGDQHILNFCDTGFFVGSLAALTTHLPSHVTIDAIEPSIVYTAPYSIVEDLYKENSTWQEFGRRLAEELYIEREQKEYEYVTLTAEDRLERLLFRYPGIENRVSQSDLALAIGITPTSMSRLLRQIKK
tara:strand:+ start:6351 stop:7010 length:660 start_codon:yes stop_codon:yes gene_type:complete